MSVGYGQAKADLDGRVGSLCLNLQNTLAGFTSLAAFIATKQDSDLTALGYTTADIAALRNVSVLAELASVYKGQQAIPTAVDVSAFAQPFLGVN